VYLNPLHREQLCHPPFLKSFLNSQIIEIFSLSWLKFRLNDKLGRAFLLTILQAMSEGLDLILRESDTSFFMRYYWVTREPTIRLWLTSRVENEAAKAKAGDSRYLAPYGPYE
jgi:hypothetical protein